MPLPLLLALAALALARSPRRPRFLSLGLWTLYGFVVLLSIPAVTNLLVNLWEYPLSSTQDLGTETWDAAIILGGSLDPALSNGPATQYELNAAAERLTAAAILWKQGRVERLVYTGGSGDPWNQERKEAPAVREFLLALGLETQGLLVEDQSRNTYENALYTGPLLTAEGLEKNLLVTSALHMRRSLAIFAKQEIPIVPCVVDTRKITLSGPIAFIPSAQGLYVSSLVLREIMGYVTYGILGRL